MDDEQRMQGPKMRAKTLTMSTLALSVATCLTAFGQGAFAQGATAPAAAQPTPAGQAWASTTTKDAPGASITLDPAQVEALKKVSIYFNDLKQMKGNFAQTGGDGKRMRGKFFVKQPGRFRFEYGFGSKLLIISDGTMLSIMDLDIKTDDKIELDRTPFRLLLRRDVDLMRDAKIMEVQEVEDLIIVSLADKSPDAPGKIKLFMAKKPTLELKEWVTTDAQGMDTRVEVSDLNKTEEVADPLFKPPSVMLQKIQ
jgi:outer membrane lipoprotein-sorting protein